MNEPPPSKAIPIEDIISRRRSGRAYRTDRPVSRAELRIIFEAARWAPSCFGDEPWRYIVCDRHRSEFSWQKAFDCLTPGNQLWAVSAPVLVLSLASTRFRRDGRPNRWAQHDTGAASQNLCLQAAAIGLMAHQMGGFDTQQAREAFAVPDELTPMAMIAIGCPAPADTLEGTLRERELAVRTRRPASAWLYEDHWAAPIDLD